MKNLTLLLSGPGQQWRLVGHQHLRSREPFPPPARHSRCTAGRPPEPATEGPPHRPSQSAPSTTPAGQNNKNSKMCVTHVCRRRSDWQGRHGPWEQRWRSSLVRWIPGHTGTVGPGSLRGHHSVHGRLARCRSSLHPTGCQSAAGRTWTWPRWWGGTTRQATVTDLQNRCWNLRFKEVWLKILTIVAFLNNSDWGNERKSFELNQLKFHTWLNSLHKCDTRQKKSHTLLKTEHTRHISNSFSTVWKPVNLINLTSAFC